MKKLGITGSLPMLLAGLLVAPLAQAMPDGAPYIPTEEAASKHSFEDARTLVERGFASCHPANPIKVQVMPDIITLSWPGYFTIVELRELNGINVQSRGFWQNRIPATLEVGMKGHVFQNGKKYGSYSSGECRGLGDDWAEVFGDVLLRLKLEYEKSHNPEADAKFKEEALRYQAMSPKPEIPEEARRFRVQAESAVTDKRFLDAVEKYEKAIEIAPWWPEAHFNRAVILAELQNFDTAIVEMKRYLLLKPDAPDARQAKDFIYTWEDHPYAVK
jgi:tetratricopeptide (TPR) repeat protein